MKESDVKIPTGTNPVNAPSGASLAEAETDGAPPVSSERKDTGNLVQKASKAVRRLIGLLDDESLGIVRAQADGVKEVLKAETESGNRHSRESCDKSNESCSSCSASGKAIVNKIGKRTSTESVRTGTKMRLVTMVKGIPIYAPEDVYEERDRIDPLHILHCNACGNEWEKRSPHYETDSWALEDYLDYVRYAARAISEREENSHWLSEYALSRLKSKSGWELPFRETIGLLAKENRYDKFKIGDKRWLRKFLKSVLDA